MTKKLKFLLISFIVCSVMLYGCSKQEESNTSPEPVTQVPVEKAEPGSMPQESTPADEAQKTETTDAGTTPEITTPVAATPEPQQTANASQQTGGQKAALDLASKSGCLACHAIDKKIVGPPWRDVSKRYLNDPNAKEKLIAKVSKGGRGAWTDVVGPAAMPPYSPRVSDENITKLVEFVLALEK